MIRVKLEGISELKERFSPKTISQKLNPILNSAANNLQTKLQNSIYQTYYTKDKLETVLDKTRIGVVRSDRDTLSFDLVYKHVPVSLAEFPNSVTKVAVNARFMDLMAYAKGKQRFVKKDWAFEFRVKVKRQSTFQVPTKYNNAGWRVKGNSLDKTDKMFVRRYKRTWDEEPINRAPIVQLFGPSLKQMAESRFKDSRAVKEFQRTLLETVEKEFKL